MAINTHQQINLKNKTKKWNRNRLIDTEKLLTIDRWEGVWGMDVKR